MAARVLMVMGGGGSILAGLGSRRVVVVSRGATGNGEPRRVSRDPVHGEDRSRTDQPQREPEGEDRSRSAHRSYTASGRRSTRRSSWALSATMIVDKLMSTAPTAGPSEMPAHANAPAAKGMATML